MPGNDVVSQRESRIGWSDDELRTCIVAYRHMQLADQSGNAINKTLKRSEVLATALQSRSPGSYEYRMANISSVILELGLPVLRGYTPRGNVGANIKGRLVAMVNDIWGRQYTPENATADYEELQTRVQSARKKLEAGHLSPPPLRSGPAVRAETKQWRFVRDPNVIAWVTSIAKGVCEACDIPALFLREDGEPYLEVHHVRPLAEGGSDSSDNAIAICPTCHRRFHHGIDKDAYRKATIKKVGRLVDHPQRQLEHT